MNGKEWRARGQISGKWIVTDGDYIFKSDDGYIFFYASLADAENMADRLNMRRAINQETE